MHHHLRAEVSKLILKWDSDKESHFFFAHLQLMEAQIKKKIALVLASGGARGIAHIGVIEELEKRGYEIASVSGSSIGSVVGGIYTSGNLPAFKEWLLKLDKIEVFNMMDFTLGRRGFIKGDRFFRALECFVKDKMIEDLPIPFAAVATDFINKKQYIFDRGSLILAIRGSVAIPTVITPLEFNQTIMIDGGVINPMPVDAVKRTDGDILTIVDINANKPYCKPAFTPTVIAPKWFSFRTALAEILEGTGTSAPVQKDNQSIGYLDIVNKSFDMMQEQIIALTVDKYKPEIHVSISRDCAGTFEFYRAEELIETGRQALIAALEEKENLILT
jgi:NTE family protein